jgi:hypothetical protein
LSAAHISVAGAEIASFRPVLTRSILIPGKLALMCWLVVPIAVAAPLPLPTADAQTGLGTISATAVEAPAARAAEEPMDVAESAIRAAADDLLRAEAERGRLAVLQQGWHPNGPTWIQSAALVNLGDFPTFDRTVERAENNLRTLEWVIEEQRRQASGRPASAETDEAAPTHWLRRLLPAEWIALLKQNREWVAAGGGALLVIVWATATFTRGTSAPPSTLNAPPVAPVPQRRRRRRHRGAMRQAA